MISHKMGMVIRIKGNPDNHKKVLYLVAAASSFLGALAAIAAAEVDYLELELLG
jgi:hypothetical protein